MTYPQMEVTFLSYLSNRYSEDDWKESRDALFSGDGDDMVALDNLRIVKAKHIPLALPAHTSPVIDRQLSMAPVRPLQRPTKVSEILTQFHVYLLNAKQQRKFKNPYLDLDAEEEGEEEENDIDNDNDGPSESPKVTCLPGSSSAARFPQSLITSRTNSRTQRATHCKNNSLSLFPP
jgi:hypothetical protein